MIGGARADPAAIRRAAVRISDRLSGGPDGPAEEPVSGGPDRLHAAAGSDGGLATTAAPAAPSAATAGA